MYFLEKEIDKNDRVFDAFSELLGLIDDRKGNMSC